MGVYGKAIITTAGRNLIAQALAGNESVRFTELKTSDYKYASTANLDALTDIPNVKQTTNITSALVTANSNVKVSAMIRNSGVTAAYYINTIGIYGNTPGFADTLIAVISAAAGDLVPAYSGAPYSFVFDVNLIIQNASNLNVSVNDAGVATVADLNALWEKAYDVYITNEVSGDVVTFPDGADMIPMKSVSVNFSPVQSFNGYSKPWGPGMGKNICSPIIGELSYNNNNGAQMSSPLSASTEKIAVDNLNSGVTLSFTTNYRAMLFAWDGNGNFVGRTAGLSTTPRTVAKNGFSSGNGNNEYDSIKYIAVRFYVADGTEEDISKILTDQVMLELGTTATAYEPYANICTISGYSSATITRTSENICPVPVIRQKYDNNTGEQSTTGSATSATAKIPVDLSRTTVTLHYTPEMRVIVFAWDENGNFVARTPGDNRRPTFIISASEFSVQGEGTGVLQDIRYIAFNFYTGNGTTSQAIIDNPPILSYESQSYTNNLPTKFFGGTIDFISGLVSSEWTEISSYSGETLPGEWLSSYDIYAPGTTPTNGAQVVYKRTTPIVIQAEPKDIYSVYGVNIAWSDQNNIDVAYRADTKLYIDTKIAETQALALENS